jgi:hypothetical protein
LQELIYQSNPTLEPISKWPHAPSMRFLPKPSPSTSDYAGQYTAFKGYINTGSTRDDLGQSGGGGHHQDRARIVSWPTTPRERLDNLHYTWQLDSVGSKRQMFGTSAYASLRSGLQTAPAPNSARPELKGGMFGLGFGLHNGRSETADPVRGNARRGMTSQSLLESCYSPPRSAQSEDGRRRHPMLP